MILRFVFNMENSATFHSALEHLIILTNQQIKDKKMINRCLNDLNNMTNISIINDEFILLLINKLCMVIQASDTTLIRSYCQFISNLITFGLTMSGRTYSTCKKWIVQALDFSAPRAQPALLSVLAKVIEFGVFDAICVDIQCLLEDGGTLRNFVKRDLKITKIDFLIIKCIDAFIVNVKHVNGTITSKLKMTIKEVVYSMLFKLMKNEYNQSHSRKILHSCIRIVRWLVINKLLNDDVDAIGEICGIIQFSMFCGIDDYSNFKLQFLHPEVIDIPEKIGQFPYYRYIQSTPRMKVKKGTNRLISNKNNEKYSIHKDSIGSEIIDTEVSSFDSDAPCIRADAIHLLHSVILEISSRNMFGYWSQVIVSVSSMHTRTLTSLINIEPITKLRQLEFNTLAEAIHSARNILIYAEEPDQPTIPTFFGIASSMIRQIHFSLFLSIYNEKNVAVLIHALKCITVLIYTTPYTRLKPQLAIELFTHCKIYISHADPTIRVAALSVFEVLALIDEFTPEILSILDAKCKLTLLKRYKSAIVLESTKKDYQDSDGEEVDIADINICHERREFEIEPQNSSNISEIYFLLQICLENISNKMVQVPVKLQSLKLLNAFINNKTYYIIFDHFELTTQYLIEACQEIESQVVLHSCRVLEKMSSWANNNIELKSHIVMTFWNIIFESLISLTQNPHANLREAACDCLGTINNDVYSQLSFHRGTLIITTLLTASNDEESSVRAASLRALGILVTLPSIEENTEFIMDLINVITIASEDQSLGVRIKAAWALANLSDCLLRRKNNNDMEPLSSPEFLKNLYEISVKAAEDGNKVKCNILRAVGNIMHLHRGIETPNDLSKGLQVLIASATLGNDMKVRWNACRSLGFIISHEPDSILPPDWREKIFPTLCDLICCSPNFKVRTNAAWALAACNSYGGYVSFLWKSVVMALDNSQHVPNFIEYPHRDALVQQLCLTLGHIAAFTELQDLQILWSEIKDHIQDIAVHMKNFHEHVLPEKTENFILAELQMKNHVENSRTLNERKVATILTNLFDSTK